MAYYRNISTTFWTDRKVDDDFTPEDKYFYLYLLTNPHTNIAGCYEIGMKQMSRETGYNEETIKRLLNRMQYEHKVIQYDGVTKEVFIINWGKYNWGKSEKVEKAVLKAAETIKSEILKKNIIGLINNNISNIDIINNNIQNTVTVTETDTVSDTETDTDTDTVTCIQYPYPMDTVSIQYPYSIDTVSEKKEKKADKSAVKVSDLDKIIFEYTNNEDLRQALKDFIKFRKAIKAPLTDRALKLCLNTLDKHGSNDAERIAVINQSIERGWKGLFELKDTGSVKGDTFKEMTKDAEGFFVDKDGYRYV